MDNTIFNEETYEQDLALMMLEVLFKKNEISINTYKSVKKDLQKEAYADELCNDGTAKFAS